jgi:hypothetical protein
MDRRERRRKARERKKLEERLRREAARPHPELTPSRRFLRALKTAVSWRRVAAGISLLGAYALVRPHVSVEPYISLNPRDPYSTQFTVKNESRVFDLHAIHCVCWPRRTQTSHNIGEVRTCCGRTVSHARCRRKDGGRDGIRTHDLLIANEEKTTLRRGSTIT